MGCKFFFYTSVTMQIFFLHLGHLANFFLHLGHLYLSRESPAGDLPAQPRSPGIYRGLVTPLFIEVCGIGVETFLHIFM